MNPKTLNQQKMDDWVAALTQAHRVFGPQARGDRYAYDRLCSRSDLRLDHDVTKLPPKKYLLPQREALVKFTSEGRFESVAEEEPLVLFGVHPYDVAAIAQMDRYFTEDKPDAHYQARRKNITIVACDVQEPSRNVFAACMGTAPTKEGFDVLLTLVGDKYVAESRTPAGDALLGEAGDLPDADDLSLARREQVWLDAEQLLKRQNLTRRPEGSSRPAGAFARASGLAEDVRDVLFLRLLRHGLPIMLLLRRAGRCQVEPGLRHTLQAMGRLHALGLRRRGGRPQLPQASRAALPAPVLPQGQASCPAVTVSSAASAADAASKPACRGSPTRSKSTMRLLED